MVLVDADAIETHLVGVPELVDVFGVILIALGRIEVLVGEVDPGRVMLLGKVLGQVLIGHQVEEGYFHVVTYLGDESAAFRERWIRGCWNCNIGPAAYPVGAGDGTGKRSATGREKSGRTGSAVMVSSVRKTTVRSGR